MATKSMGFRLNNSFMCEDVNPNLYVQISPEIMFGASKKLMLHTGAFFTDQINKFKFNGGEFYSKYRFYSRDEIHNHFRMATFARIAFRNTFISQPAIDLNNHNSGYELGIVATKLKNKIALSSTVSLLHAMDNGANYKFPFSKKDRTAISYNLSIGKLLLPKEYINYNQTNVNGMLEFLCQTNLNSGKTFVDAAPVLQFIILSKMRFDLGYRFPLSNDLMRTASKGFLLRFEYNIFNAFK